MCYMMIHFSFLVGTISGYLVMCLGRHYQDPCPDPLLRKWDQQCFHVKRTSRHQSFDDHLVTLARCFADNMGLSTNLMILMAITSVWRESYWWVIVPCPPFLSPLFTLPHPYPTWTGGSLSWLFYFF